MAKFSTGLGTEPSLMNDCFTAIPSLTASPTNVAFPEAVRVELYVFCCAKA